MKPKILIIIDQLEIGGAEIFVLDLYEKLSRDFEIYFLSLKKSNPTMTEKANRFAKKVVILDLNFKKPLSLVPKIRKEIEKISPEIIHTHLTYSDIYGRLAAKKAGTEIIFSTVHSLEPWRGKLLNLTGLRMALFDKYLVKSSKKIIVISKKMKEILIKKEGISEEKIIVIHNGVNTKKFKPEPKKLEIIKKLRIEDNKIILGFIGRLEEPKGLTYLIEAFGELGKKDIVLLIVGDGTLKNELESQCKKLQIQNQVYFMGKRNDIVDLLNIIDIFVLPSIWEGLPISLLEAMACRKKIIATNIGGVKEVIDNKKEGRLVEPKNSGQLKRAIEELIKRPKEAEKLATNTLKKVRGTFSLGRSVQRYKKIYFKALEKS